MIYLFILLPNWCCPCYCYSSEKRSKHKPTIDQESCQHHLYSSAAGSKSDVRRKPDSCQRVRLFPYSVLIVDDQFAIRLLMRELFELECYGI